MTKRAKKVIHTGITSEQMESAMGEYAITMLIWGTMTATPLKTLNYCSKHFQGLRANFY